MAKTISVYDVLINFVSLITFMLDVGTDILVAVQFFEKGDIIWGSLTAGFVAVPTLVIQIFSLKWHLSDNSLSVLSCLPHLFLFAPVQRYLRVIRLGLKARSTRHFYDIDRVYREQNDVCILRLVETFLEATPQLCLQLYIILVTRNITPLAGVSAISSLISLAWALTAYSDGLRLAYRDVYKRNWCSIMMHWLSHSAITAARVMALVVFATVFKAWVFLVVGLHWIAMTIWISVKGTDFGDGPCERGLFQIVAGFIYIFCFLNLRDGRSRHRMLAFYLVFLVENTGLVAIWFLYKESTPILDIVTPAVVFGGFFLGVLCILLYYRFLHPSGPIYLYTVKTVVHNGVLNNQRDNYPGLFDLTAGTQLSVLGSDIIELSRDMDHTTLSLSRMSNRSSINVSQQHLQLAWEAGFAGRSSSSDSSLDMMDVGSRRTCPQSGTLTSSRSASSTRQLLQEPRIIDTDRSRSWMCSEQADRQNQMDDLESTVNSRRRKPYSKVYNEKDIYGFHESRFNGTYHSPLKNDNFIIEKPVALSPLDAAKLWQDTAGRFRRNDDTLSTLDASDLLEQSYNQHTSVSSWASYSRRGSTHSVTVHTETSQHCDDYRRSRSRPNSRTLHASEMTQGKSSQVEPVSGMSLLRESYLDSSLPDLVDASDDKLSFSGSRESIPVYEYLSQASSVPANCSGTSQPALRYDRAVNPHYHKTSPRYETAVVGQADSGDHMQSSEDESGVFTNTSHKSDRKSLQYGDVSLNNCREPVYAVPYSQYTQSAPGPTRHVRHTGQEAWEGLSMVHGNNEDIPGACRSVLPDTPWKLDYLNLEPLKTVLLKVQHMPEEKQLLVREYLRDLNESLHDSCHPSPIKMQELTDSPARFGRSIDLFNSRAWHKVKQIVDSEQSGQSDNETNMDSNYTAPTSKSRRSLLSQESGRRSRPLSGGSDSGYQPFQRSYLDSENTIRETSPYAVGRNSSKMSCIRGDAANRAPVRGSPMPVKNRSRDWVERRKSKEIDVTLANRSCSQSSLTGKYKKRISNENKENSNSNIHMTLTNTNTQPFHNKSNSTLGSFGNPPQKQNLTSSNLNLKTQTNSDVLCPSLASSYRQAITNTNRPNTMSQSSEINQSDLRLDDLYSKGEGHIRPSRGTDRQPFQSIQNTPDFSPIGDRGRQYSGKMESFNTFASTPKVASSLHSLALIDVYGSPVEEQFRHNSGTGLYSGASRSRQTSVDRAKSVDYIR